jgi:hypothetical protein
MPPGDAPATERLDETFARAEQLGWSIEASPEGPLLRREGYNVLARALRDDILQQCRTAPPEQQRCGDTVVVRAE